jgi:hypothetical protein
LAAGAQSYVMKPVSADRLSRVISKHFNGAALGTD